MMIFICSALVLILILLFITLFMLYNIFNKVKQHDIDIVSVNQNVMIAYGSLSKQLKKK